MMLPTGQRKNRYTALNWIVMMILVGAMVFVALPRFGSNPIAARRTAAILQITNLTIAIENYKADVGEFPKGTNGLSELVRSKENSVSWKGPYIRPVVVSDGSN